jgi:hypothetical protein
MKRARFLAVASLIATLASDPARATPGTIHVPPRPCPDLSQNLSYGRARGSAAPDGRGGAFVVWGDDRAVSVQRFGPSGAIAGGWPAPGFTLGWISPAEEGYQSFVAADSAGGALVAWIGRQGEVRLQRVTPGCGVAEGWPAEGLVLCALPGTGRHPAVALNDRGSAMIIWREQETNGTQSIRLARVELAGALAAGWPANGRVVESGDGLSDIADLVSDGRDGAIVTWGRAREAVRTTALVLQRVLRDGTLAPGWPAEGLTAGERVALGQSFDEDAEQPMLAEDGQGGAWLTWCTGTRVGPEEYELDVMAQRVTGEGRIAPGWRQGGVSIAADRGDQRRPTIANDRRGLLVAWFDDTASGRVRVARVEAAGAVSPWGAQPVRSIERLAIGTDGSGGAYVSWTTNDDLNAPPPLLRWNAGGPGHPVEMSSRPAGGVWDSNRLGLVTDGSGALMVWSGLDTVASPHRARVGVATHRTMTAGPRP